MRDVVKASGVSMGALYGEVKSKEDLIIALAIYHLDRKNELFRRIAALHLPLAEKLFAFIIGGYLNKKSLPIVPRILHIATHPSIRHKASTIRNREFDAQTKEALAIIQGCVVQEEVNYDRTLNYLVLNLWGMLEGTYRLNLLKEDGVLEFCTEASLENPFFEAMACLIENEMGVQIDQACFEALLAHCQELL